MQSPLPPVQLLAGLCVESGEERQSALAGLGTCTDGIDDPVPLAAIELVTVNPV
jgi:hypothetical protein